MNNTERDVRPEFSPEQIMRYFLAGASIESLAIITGQPVEAQLRTELNRARLQTAVTKAIDASKEPRPQRVKRPAPHKQLTPSENKGKNALAVRIREVLKSGPKSLMDIGEALALEIGDRDLLKKTIHQMKFRNAVLREERADGLVMWSLA